MPVCRNPSWRVGVLKESWNRCSELLHQKLVVHFNSADVEHMKAMSPIESNSYITYEFVEKEL